MSERQYLVTPGPTPVPERIRRAMARPLIHHRTAEFRALFRAAADGLSWLFQTAEPVLLLNGSGTTAMEAALVSTMRRGDRMLAALGGKFGARWRDIGAAFGLDVVTIDVPWGEAVDPESIRERLDRDPSITAVFTTASESSTGVRHPVEEIARITADRPHVITIVDAVSALGAFDLPMDAAGLDVVLTASQKALMLPPGQCYVALSQKAWRRAERADLPRFSLDLLRERRTQAAGDGAFTPAIAHTFGLVEAISMLREEGLTHVFARHDRLARAARAGCAALGLHPFAAKSPSPSVTAIFGPPGVPTSRIVAHLYERYGVVVAGGQDAAKDRILRLGHLGYVHPLDIITAISAIEMTLADIGVPIERGAGVAAAQREIGAR